MKKSILVISVLLLSLIALNKVEATGSSVFIVVNYSPSPGKILIVWDPTYPQYQLPTYIEYKGYPSSSSTGTLPASAINYTTNQSVEIGPLPPGDNLWSFKLHFPNGTSTGWSSGVNP